MAPRNGTTSTAPCNGTLVPRPIRQSGSSPSPRIGSKNPYSYRYLGNKTNLRRTKNWSKKHYFWIQFSDEAWKKLHSMLLSAGLQQLFDHGNKSFCNPSELWGQKLMQLL